MEPSFPPLPQFYVPHHFRLGVPSYVYPADILPNVEALAPLVDDIELVLFESSPEVRGQRSEVSLTNLPSVNTIARLAELAQQHDLTYTVHFPIDRHLGSPDIKERRALQKQMLAIMDRTRPLRPYAYILHLEGITRGQRLRPRSGLGQRYCRASARPHQARGRSVTYLRGKPQLPLCLVRAFAGHLRPGHLY